VSGIELSLRLSDAAALADLISQYAGREVDTGLREEVARRGAALQLSGIEPLFGSLARHPDQPATLFLAADVHGDGQIAPLLLRVALVSTPADDWFSDVVPAGRLRPGGGREIMVDAIPFRSTDYANVRAFAEKIDRAFLPRPQRGLPAIAAGNRHPEFSLPAVFDAYRAIVQRRGLNIASTVQLSATREMTVDSRIAARDGENPIATGHTRVSIRHLYHAGLWAAARAGWREGYTAEADHVIVSGNDANEIARSTEEAKEAIRHAAGYTKFTTDTSRLFELRADPRHPAAWSDGTVSERFEAIFRPEERRWILGEFTQPFRMEARTCSLGRDEVVRLAVKFGRSLQLNEELHDWIRQVKAAEGIDPAFDFEPSLDEAETLTTPEELLFCMHWLRARGRPAQLVPPNLGFKKRQAYPEAMTGGPQAGIGLEEYVEHKMWPELAPRVAREFGGDPLAELGARVGELAAVARFFDGTLSVHSGSGKQAQVLEEIGRAANGRVNYKISGELQLQLLDVLYEQPAGSHWRELYERMARRANRFAAAGAFGEESALAVRYLEMGRGSYLGDSARGRVDGNLFLVFWVGNLVGSRDVESPDGDRRFFKEKIEAMPADLVGETRRRNTEYILWLARHLWG
jgi:hypothetical protein